MENKNDLNRIIDNIEDYTRVRDWLDSVCCSIENGMQMPNYIPVCNEPMLTDQMSKVSECIENLRKRLL